MSNHPEEDTTHQLVEPPLLCDGCAKFTAMGTEWHCITSSDRNACIAGETAGYWLCTECHNTAHEWMERNPHVKNGAKESMHRVFRRIVTVMEAEPRKYTRSIRQDDDTDNQDT